jgi:NAD(P)-dependent dehydrogenase (short-subunit alcohol dehydrogenase family)
MLQADSLKDKVIVVTGGATGLGKAMTKYFLEMGAKVVITSRKDDNLQETKIELEQLTGGKVHTVVCDVREYGQVEAMLQSTLDTFGKVDTLVNNAAGNFISPTEKLSHRAFNIIVDIVLKGSYNCTLAFGKHWISQNQSNKTILNIVTTYAWTGSAYVVPSACAKAGVLALTRSLAVEWGKHNIRLNAIAPGPFPTKGAWDRLLPGDLASKFDMKNQNPLGRVGEHHELAHLAGYLVSDFASFINGECVTIDGGEWLQGAGQFSLLREIPDAMWDEIATMTKNASSK